MRYKRGKDGVTEIAKLMSSYKVGGKKLGPLTGLEGLSPREAGAFSRRSGVGTGGPVTQIPVEGHTGKGNAK